MGVSYSAQPIRGPLGCGGSTSGHQCTVTQSRMSAHLDPWPTVSQIRNVLSIDSFVEKVGLCQAWKEALFTANGSRVLSKPELPHLFHTYRLPTSLYQGTLLVSGLCTAVLEPVLNSAGQEAVRMCLGGLGFAQRHCLPRR